MLLASITMMKSGFGKASARIGVITGVFGLLSLTGFFPLVMANALGAARGFGSSSLVRGHCSLAELRRRENGQPTELKRGTLWSKPEPSAESVNE